GTPTWLAAQSLRGLGAALRAAGRLDKARQVVEQAVSIARVLRMPRVLANALEQEGHLVAVEDPERATQLHHEALAERVEHGLRVFYADSLDALAMLAGRSGRTAEAAWAPATRRAMPWATSGALTRRWAMEPLRLSGRKARR